MSRVQDEIKAYERLAVVEQKLDDHIEDEEEKLGRVIEKLDRIELEFSRYRGIVGGLLIAVTAIVAAIKLYGGAMVALIRGS